MPSKESVRALRTLLLPISATGETELNCAATLETFLKNSGILAEDYDDWVALHLASWEELNTPSNELKTAVQKILISANGVGFKQLSEHYFKIHSKLCEDHFLTHAEGRWFLSHSLMILEMSCKEKLTAAQISRMLTVRDGRTRFSQQAIKMFLASLKHSPTLTLEQVKALFDSDKVEEAPYFADASLEEAAEIVDVTARSLGYTGSISKNLTQLAPSDKIDKYSPYLQMLHFQCTLAEYFDHAVTDLYEFGPRGQAAIWLFDAYPEALTRAANPFLNNAKSVERADPGWVRMKKKAERPGTAALEGILSNLEMMGFAARRELARLIRLWLHRVIRLSEPSTVALPASFTQVEWEAVLDAVGDQNTSTYGIIEQRVVDALSWGMHGIGSRARGIGAPVNATNISSRRLGDCDYQSSEEKTIFAYESHGGILTDIYVKEHLRTLKKSFALRQEELESIAELGAWKINVVFVAHSLNTDQYKDADILDLGDLRIEITLITFKQFIDRWKANQPNYGHLDQMVIGPLQEKHTPNEVRRKILAMKELAS